MAALDQEGLRGLMDLFAVIQDTIRAEIGAAEKRILARMEELLAAKKKAPTGIRKVQVELAAAIGTDSGTARHLVVAIHTELGRWVELEDVPDLAVKLKPAQEIAPNALQWAVRSLVLRRQRDQTREQRKLEEPEEPDAKQELAFWCQVVRAQCKEGAKKNSTKLPRGCGRMVRPRRGSKAWTEEEPQAKKKRRRADRKESKDSKESSSSS